jgi:hypothetical protein
MFGSRRILAPCYPLSSGHRAAVSESHCHPVYPEERRERSEGPAFRLSTLHALSVFAFSSSDVCPFNFKLSAVNLSSVTPFLATLTSHPQLAENKTTLSPAGTTLTSRVKHNPLFATLTKNTRGGDLPSSVCSGTGFSLCSFETVYFGELRRERSAGMEESRPPSSHQSRITTHRFDSLSSTSHESPVTSH